MQRTDLTHYLDTYLNIPAIKDYGPQGLQVETENQSITRIALAVDVAPAILEAVANWQADMLLVHHGILWRDVERIAGPLGERIRLMMKHGINLYAAHLPLDAHPEVGNNAVLGKMFGLEEIMWWCEPTNVPIGVLGRVAPQALATLAADVNEKLHTQSQILSYGPETVEKLAIISGAGANYIEQARNLGADTLLTGESSHASYWHAADYGLNVIYAGHYATETVGVRALGKHLNQLYGLETRFFDFPTQM